MLTRVLPSATVICAALLRSFDELVWPLSAVLIVWLIRGKTLSLSQMIGAIILVSSVTILTKANSGE